MKMLEKAARAIAVEYYGPHEDYHSEVMASEQWPGFVRLAHVAVEALREVELGGPVWRAGGAASLRSEVMFGEEPVSASWAAMIDAILAGPDAGGSDEQVGMERVSA